MKKRKIGNTAVSLLLAVCFLTACGAQTAPSPVASPSESAASPEQAEEVPEITEGAESGENPIGVDWSAFQSTMTPEEWDGLSLYLPVLEESTAFHWINGTELTEDAPYHRTSEGVQTETVTLAEFHKARWAWNGEAPEKLVLNRLAVQDVDGDGVPELALLFEELGWYYLVFHQEGETFYAVEFPIRWFEDLRQNGVYLGSGGAGDSTYYQMTFRGGRFEQAELAHRVEWANGCTCTLAGETVTEADFDAWLAETMVDGVTWYGPDGTALPENQ
ncbi:MAG: hypothetical protein MR803_04760 [Clostridiales bacterium]|nr:hypothetical protein [Clostridiales bacterium]